MKTAILITLLAFFGVLKAQTIKFPADTFESYGSTVEGFVANIGITNNSTDAADKTFTWRFMDYNKTAGWDLNVCDNYSCLNGVSSSTTHDFDLNKGQTGLFYVDFIPNSINGNSKVTIIVTSKMNANNADTITVNGNAWLTGLKKMGNTKSVSFYPNPVKDQLTFKFETSQDIKVDIYNILGVKVKTFIHDGSSSQVALSDLQNGVYFIRFNENGKAYTKQFVKAQ